MARPVKIRVIESFPEIDYFIPVGKPRCRMQETILKLEELEAMRLKDIENLNQEECAKRMAVSRQTFQNIIDSARNKVAIALTEGNAISISGGNYISKKCKFVCKSCGLEYDVKLQQDKSICPECKSEDVSCYKKDMECKKRCYSDSDKEMTEGD